jgi:6-carboxyhexanoate--CoA ligase
MSKDRLYSIRMRATIGNKHVSGAERIVSSERIDDTVRTLVARARDKAKGPDQIVVTIEVLEDIPIRTLRSLDVVTLNAPEVNSGRSVASRVLQLSGVSLCAVQKAIHAIGNGASPSGDNMRGAMIMDAQTGERIEPDRERGVRASRFDWHEETFKKIDRSLSAVSLTHFRTREALALATKVAHTPALVAELCWSDEADYTAGYVASLKTGYVRLPFLKQNGDRKGGRAFFVDRGELNMDALLRYLRIEPVLIIEAGECRPAITPEEYFGQLH